MKRYVEAEPKGSASCIGTQFFGRTGDLCGALYAVFLPARGLVSLRLTSFSSTTYEQRDFPFARLGGEIFEQMGSGSAVIGLKLFGQFARHTDFTVRIERDDSGDSFGESVGGFEKNRGLPSGKRFLKLAILATGFHGEKSAKIESIGRQA